LPDGTIELNFLLYVDLVAAMNAVYMIPYFCDTVKGAARKVLLLSAHILTTLTGGVLTSPDVVMDSVTVRHVFRYKKCEGCEKFCVFRINVSLLCREGHCAEMIVQRCSVLSGKAGRSVLVSVLS